MGAGRVAVHLVMFDIDGTLVDSTGFERLAGLPNVRVATQRAMRGERFKRATYFGDGPWDQRASAELGYGFIAVGGTVAHDVAFADLREIDAILARLEVLEAEATSC